jgi:hypothetical protein
MCFFFIIILILVTGSADFNIRGEKLNQTEIKMCFDKMIWGDSAWQFGLVNVSDLLRICTK